MEYFVKTKDIMVDNIKIATVVYSPKKPKAQVYISTGLSGPKEGKENVLASLAMQLADNNFQVIAYDYMGHGESGGKSQNLTIEKSLEELSSVIENYRSELPINLFGWSMGALLSVEYLKRTKESVNSLVFWSPAFDFQRSFIENPNSLFGKDIIKQKDNALDYVLIDFNSFKLGKEFINTVGKYKPLEAMMKIKSPKLMIQAQNDYVLNLEINREFKPYMDAYYELDAIHALFDKKEDAINITVEWFNKYNEKND